MKILNLSVSVAFDPGEEKEKFIAFWDGLQKQLGGTLHGPRGYEITDGKRCRIFLSLDFPNELAIRDLSNALILQF